MSDTLIQAFEEWVPPPPPQIEYRVYHNNGAPLFMSSCNHPDGEYIVITKELYDSANYNFRIINGKPVFDNPNLIKVQLKKVDHGIPVVRGYANLVVENNEYEDIEYYGRNN